jgi:hypothetical protein
MPVARSPWGDLFNGPDPEMTPPSLVEEERAMDEHERAHRRLMRSLSPMQQNTYSSQGYIDVTSNRGNQYRIFTENYIGNVLRMSDGRRFCCHLSYYPTAEQWNGRQPTTYPIEDHILAQALMIRTNEPVFLNLAIG